jgi:excisionase family DNA binding protein
VSIPNFQEWERVMNPMESDHEILTVREICDLLQVHQSTIYKMVRQGKIPCFRIGSDWRFRRDRIVRWMADQSMVSEETKREDEEVREQLRHVDMEKQKKILKPLITPSINKELARKRKSWAGRA